MVDIINSYEIYENNISETFKDRYKQFTEYKSNNGKFDYSVSKFLELIFPKFDGEKIAANLIDKNKNIKYQWVQDDEKYPSKEDKIKAILNFWTNSSDNGTNIHNCIENTYIKNKINVDILPQHKNELNLIDKTLDSLEIQLEQSKTNIKRKLIEEIRNGKKFKLNELEDEKKKIENEISTFKEKKELHSQKIFKLNDFSNKNVDNFKIQNMFPEFKLYITEYPVFSFEFSINGRIDAIFLDPNNNKLILVDWKSGGCKNLYASYGKKCKSIFTHYSASKYMRFCMQLNLYRVLVEKYYDFEIESMKVVLVNDFEKELEIEVEKIPEMDYIFQNQDNFKNFIYKNKTQQETDIYSSLSR